MIISQTCIGDKKNKKYKAMNTMGFNSEHQNGYGDTSLYNA